MKITNKHDLPEAFLNYEKVNAYTKGDADISATTLIDSPKIAYLKTKHYPEIEEDVSDRIMSILGTAVHNILEQGAGEYDRVEERMYAYYNGVKLSGQIDLMTPVQGGYLIQDYKTCSAFSIQANPEGKVEWERQLNVYASLAEHNDIDVMGLEVVAIIRDWTASGLKRSNDYPKNAVVRIPIKLWDPLDRQKYIENRVDAHQEASDRTMCTADEMWKRETKYAVHKKSRGSLNQRATRVFDNMGDAGSFVLASQADSEIVERPGVRARCDGNYCGVAQYCNQYQPHKRSS
jgi:hypothetical protein